MKEYQKIKSLYKFDNHFKATDEYASGIFEYCANNKWLATEKIDGTNVRVHWDGYRVSWSGRTDKSELPNELAVLLQHEFGQSEPMFEQLFGDKEVYLFMEGYGGKIQGGIYGGHERLIGFDVMVNNYYLDRNCIAEIFYNFKIPTLPIKEFDNMDEIVKYVKAGHLSNYAIGKETIQEGLVCVPKVELYDKQNNRIIVKVKYKDLTKQ